MSKKIFVTISSSLETCLWMECMKTYKNKNFCYLHSSPNDVLVRESVFPKQQQEITHLLKAMEHLCRLEFLLLSL